MASDPSQLVITAESQSASITDPTALQQLQQALDGATALLRSLQKNRAARQLAPATVTRVMAET